MTTTVDERELERQYVELADAERYAGGSIEIDRDPPYVAITLSDGFRYFFQGEDAEELLDEVPEWVYAEDYLLAEAQDW